MPPYSPAEEAAIEAALAGGSAPAGAGEEGSPASNPDSPSWLGQHAALAANSATFGLGPKLMYAIKGQKGEDDANAYLSQAREDNPISGVIAEIAGGLAVPIPGLGIGKAALGVGKAALGTGARLGVKAGVKELGALGAAKGLGETSILWEAGKGAIQGAGAGAVRGATQAYGEGGTSGLGAGLERGIQGAKVGAAGGAAVGGILGGVGGMVAKRAADARLSATGAGSGEITDLLRMGNSNPYKTLQSIKSKELTKAEDMGLIGKFGQSSANVAKRSTAEADRIGKELGDVVKKAALDPKTLAQTTDVETVAMSRALEVAQDPNANKDLVSGANAFLEWLTPMFARPKGGGPFNRGDTMSMIDMQKIRENARIALQGHQGFNTPADSVKNMLIKDFRKELSEFMVRSAQKGSDKSLAPKLAELSDKFHVAATVRDLSQAPGQRWDVVRQTPLGKGLMAMGHTLGLAPYMGAPAARVVGAAATAPGVTPNSLIALDRLRRRNLMPSAGVAGGLGGSMIGSNLASE